jgi:DNA-binding response OmpR family regulator
VKAAPILVVEDDFYTAEAMTFALEAEGYCVLVACNGRDALHKLALSPVDLIVLDVMMPIMDGSEFACALRADDRFASIPMIVTSALSEARVHSLFGHVDRFLRKPFPMRVMLDAIRESLRAAQGERS